MSSLLNFKKQIQRYCSFPDTPSQELLTKLANEISQKRPQSPNELILLVKKICPNVRAVLLEGVDNSDLNTLLALAIQVARSKNSS